MSDDIIARLYCSYAEPPCEVCTFCAARAEIERLRRALDLAVGELSTNDRYRMWNPEQLRQQLLDEAVRGE